MAYKLQRPGSALMNVWGPNTPEYDYNDFKDFKPGDMVYVIVHNIEDDHLAIDKTRLIEKNNGFEYKWFIDKYNQGYSVDFGETLHSSFEEAKAVLVQYKKSPKEWREIMLLTEEELKPKGN